MLEIFKRIAHTTLKDLATDSQRILYMVEEVGEVAAASIIENGLKAKPLKETKEEECVDVIITALGILLKNPEWDYDRVVEFMGEKLKKWEKRISD